MLTFIFLVIAIVGLVISHKANREQAIRTAKIKLMHDEIMAQNAKKNSTYNRYGS